MTDREVVDLVRDVLGRVRPDLSAEFRSIGLETRFESLRIDSIDNLRMITFMEDDLGFVFQEEELGQIETVKDIATLVQRRKR
jgi:acyl carrier protein